ncbi:hypothetical protein ABT033_03225 [Streptomyces pharetrae]|uniref:hypothetical protein n=1 Tax=Streptomyces pharetrae TaxID=291370 RepID=UPI00335CC237
MRLRDQDRPTAAAAVRALDPLVSLAMCVQAGPGVYALLLGAGMSRDIGLGGPAAGRRARAGPLPRDLALLCSGAFGGEAQRAHTAAAVVDVLCAERYLAVVGREPFW